MKFFGEKQPQQHNNPKGEEISRRDFLKAAGAALGASAFGIESAFGSDKQEIKLDTQEIPEGVKQKVEQFKEIKADLIDLSYLFNDFANSRNKAMKILSKLSQLIQEITNMFDNGVKVLVHDKDKSDRLKQYIIGGYIRTVGGYADKARNKVLEVYRKYLIDSDDRLDKADYEKMNKALDKAHKIVIKSLEYSRVDK